MKVDCRNCDNFRDNVPIRIIDIKAVSPLDYDVIHFEDGYGCTWNGMESVRLEDLQKGSCRCRGDGVEY